MDIKLKIVIVIFVAIAFLYAGHFIINYMATTKQEGFTEDFNDVEHYEEPAEPSRKADNKVTSKYDQRILILDDIEKLQIKDKEVKGKLMETMFDDDILNQVASMSSSERLTFIKKKYDSFHVTSGESSAAAAGPTTNAESKNKFELETEDPVKVTIPASTLAAIDTTGLITKTQETLSALKSVQSGLSEIHKIAESFKSHAPVEKKAQIEKSVFKEPYIPPTTLIEGFENMRSFAPLF